ITPPLTSTHLTVDPTARSHNNIFAGNQAGPLDGNARLTYNGKTPDPTSTVGTGYQAYFLTGGNQTGPLTGNTSVEMNDGWVRGWILGGGQSPMTGDTRVTMRSGLIGPVIGTGETVGQAEIYGGGSGDNGTVKGDTHVTVEGKIFDEATYEPGDKVTLVRQHVLGGGQS
ncbi:hypothetical protein G3I76_54245, partial [Streptomyces sp. SID11233]|nr:hypothetical protein [Streptomyces sp. SID11233]